MDDMIREFKKISKSRWIYLQNGDSRKGNQCYDKLVEISIDLREQGKLIELESLLGDPDDGTKFEAASILLTIDNKKAEEVLGEIAKKNGSIAFTAEMTLQQWKLGNIRF